MIHSRSHFMTINQQVRQKTKSRDRETKSKKDTHTHRGLIDIKNKDQKTGNPGKQKKKEKLIKTTSPT